MDTAKAHFLKKDFIPLLKSIPVYATPRWGKMAPQQMVEHFTESVRIAAGTFPNVPRLTPAENLPKMQEFLMSDKPFRENTQNQMVPETPAPMRHASMAKALNELQNTLDVFFQAFYSNENLTTLNPFFGDLNFEMNVQVLYKHAVHHLRQFGVAVAPVTL
jgi:hypothetical protein